MWVNRELLEKSEPYFHRWLKKVMKGQAHFSLLEIASRILGQPRVEKVMNFMGQLSCGLLGKVFIVANEII